jgi:hypothetical protein
MTVQSKITNPRSVKPPHKPGINDSVLRTIVFISVLILAGIAIIGRVDSPVVWTFLGVAIGRMGIRGI